jgi:hypothetical protein
MNYKSSHLKHLERNISELLLFQIFPAENYYNFDQKSEQTVYKSASLAQFKNWISIFSICSYTAHAYLTFAHAQLFSS